MKAGDKIDFQYTGTPQEFTTPVNGVYQLEVWGAEGGSVNSTTLGGKGGYSKGMVSLIKDSVLLVYIGGKGEIVKSSNVTFGGWNGGGGCFSDNGATGGGATDFRLVSGGWDSSPSLLSRILVAGGGGGSGWSGSTSTQMGGAGGGETGISGSDKFGSQYAVGLGGTQTAGGSYSGSTSGSGQKQSITEGMFGLGGRGSGSGSGGGGGGGGWFGGGGGLISPAGGGSGYALTDTSHKPSGYTPTSDYWMTDTQLLAGNVNVPLTTGSGTQLGHSGNGFARITLIEPLGSNLDMKCNIKGQMRDVDTMLVKVNGTWREVEQIIGKRNGSWNLPK